MKITIDTDEKSTGSAAPAATIASPATVAEDAGSAPADSVNLVPAAGASDDGGMPPAWLIEAVNRAIASDGSIPDVSGEYQDAGSGPREIGNIQPQ